MTAISPGDIPRMRQFLDERMPRYLSVLEEMVGINSFTGNPKGVNVSFGEWEKIPRL